MVVKIKDPKVQSYASTATQSDIPIPDKADVPYSFVSGECQQNSYQYANNFDSLLNELVAQEDIG